MCRGYNIIIVNIVNASDGMAIGEAEASTGTYEIDIKKPVYNDHLMGYFSAFWSSSRWPRAT